MSLRSRNPMRAMRTSGPAGTAAILLVVLAGGAAAGDVLPERNPLRKIGLPLPERSPLREAELPLPERNPVREAGLPRPERNPLRVVPEASAQTQPGKGGHWPRLVPGTPEILKSWSAEEIQAERARCADVLKAIEAETEPAEPVRNGGCGSAGPVKLIRIGKAPHVSLSPPAITTCDMAVALARWMEKDVQPAARRLLGKPVTRISNISDYACRNATARTSTRLSEHALANALDIRDFVTEDGQLVDLKRDWGPTARDIAAQIEAEKAADAARKAAAEEAAAGAAKDAAAQAGGQNAADNKPPADGASIEAKGAKEPADAKIDPNAEARSAPAAADKLGRTLSSVAHEEFSPRARRRLKREQRMQARFAAREAARVAREAPPALLPVSASLAAAAENPGPRGRFLREIHEAACGTFGTVLGPEANEAHRDHFHLDMAKRRYKSFCE
ncbi:MAG: extensin family protein [Hyphomicrobiaceae bacterium]